MHALGEVLVVEVLAAELVQERVQRVPHLHIIYIYIYIYIYIDIIYIISYIYTYK